MALGVSKIVITPMQRIVIAITAAEQLPLQYDIALERASNGAVLMDDFTGLLYRSPQLLRLEEYEVTIQATHGDPELNEVYQYPDLVRVDPKQPMAVLLRQAVWDILFDAEIELDGRPLYALHDGYLRPSVLRQGQVPDITLPAVEVGMPILRTTRFVSNARKREEWRIPIRLLDDIHKENPDELGAMWLLAEYAQKHVDETANLNLGARGVLDKAWEWRVMEDPDQQRDRMSGLRLWLTVYVERAIGATG